MDKYKVITEIGGGFGGDVYLAEREGKRYILTWLDDGKDRDLYFVYEAPKVVKLISRYNEEEFREEIQDYLDNVVDIDDQVSRDNIEW